MGQIMAGFWDSHCREKKAIGCGIKCISVACAAAVPTGPKCHRFKK